MVRVSGTHLSKGLVTTHVLSATVSDGFFPPLMPGEWIDAHSYISVPPSGMHCELEALEKFFFPAIYSNLLARRCVLALQLGEILFRDYLSDAISCSSVRVMTSFQVSQQLFESEPLGHYRTSCDLQCRRQSLICPSMC